jgi:hypothetical protein
MLVNQSGFFTLFELLIFLGVAFAGVGMVKLFEPQTLLVTMMIFFGTVGALVVAHNLFWRCMDRRAKQKK